MAKSYKQRADDVARRAAEKSKTARDIAPLPKVKNARRRKSCRLNFRLFCETYFSEVFILQWSEDHLTVIRIIERAILNGGLFAVALPRGSGKTSLTLAAAVWALLYGHRNYVVLVGASEDHAAKLLKNIIVDLETNKRLAEDFPEVCYPIARLEHITKRIQGQTFNGKPTLMQWTAKEFVLPTMPKSVASGGRIAVAGITGAIRGMNAKLANGRSIRPSLVLVDDPQTRESAYSPKQVSERLAIVNGDILGLAGPGQKISAVMPVTVIAKNDLADQVLDREKAPVWQGVRSQLLKSEPTNVKLWEEYADFWATCHRAGGDIKAATEFYKRNRAAMDEGAEANWPQRKNDDEASAVQHAMNLKFRDEAAFAAEYQNQPLSLEAVTPLLLTPEQVATKSIEGLARGVVPSWATKLVAMIDVQQTALYYAVVACGEQFSAHICDYGAFPEQSRSFFFLREVNPSLATIRPGVATEGQLRGGLDSLSQSLLSRNWQCVDGKTKTIDRLFVDAGNWTELIKQFALESANRARILATKGFGVAVDQKPMDEWRFNDGDRRGWSWIYRRETGLLNYDTNSWKTLLAERLLMNAGEAGNISLFAGSPAQHRLITHHLTSETVTPVTANGRTVNIWRPRPTHENHLLDCVVGALVAASEQGIRAIGHQAQLGTVQKKKGRRYVMASN